MARTRKQPTTIAALRAQKGLTQYRLAKEAGLSQTHLRKIEMGLIKDPSASVAMAIADALGADVRDLFPQRAA